MVKSPWNRRLTRGPGEYLLIASVEQGFKTRQLVGIEPHYMGARECAQQEIGLSRAGIVGAIYQAPLPKRQGLVHSQVISALAGSVSGLEGGASFAKVGGDVEA